MFFVVVLRGHARVAIPPIRFAVIYKRNKSNAKRESKKEKERAEVGEGRNASSEEVRENNSKGTIRKETQFLGFF